MRIGMEGRSDCRMVSEGNALDVQYRLNCVATTSS